MKSATCEMLKPTKDSPCRSYVRPINESEPGFCKHPTLFHCIEAMKQKLPTISYADLADYIHCRLRYKYRSIDGLHLKPEHLPEYLKLGRAWKAYIQYLYNGTDYNMEIQSLQLDDIQQAKTNALARAGKDLEIIIKKEGLIGCQYKIYVPVGQEQIIVSVDRAYDDHIVECKLSGRPDFYRQLENLTYQLGTYFMGNDAWEFADVEIIRVPTLKLKPDETAEAYEERCYGDIVSRPAFYFLGWNRKTRKYGVRFWRSEFDLDEIFRTYVWVFQELRETLRRGSWYPNYLACHVPAPCMFLPIKKSGVVSPEIYERKEVKK